LENLRKEKSLQMMRIGLTVAMGTLTDLTIESLIKPIRPQTKKGQVAEATIDFGRNQKLADERHRKIAERKERKRDRVCKGGRA
jgi:hypothetical protein